MEVMQEVGIDISSHMPLYQKKYRSSEYSKVVSGGRFHFLLLIAYCYCSKWANVNCYYLFQICSWLSPIILRPLIKHLIRSFILWLFLCFTAQKYALFIMQYVV